MIKKSLVDQITEEILDVHKSTPETSKKIKKEKSIKDATDYIKSKGGKVKFPVDAFPTIIQEILNDWHKCTNIPVEYFGTAMLVAVSTAIGNKIQIQITPTWFEAPVLYASIIGPNGIGKSPVWNYALAPIEEISQEYHTNHQLNMKNYFNNLAIAASKKRTVIDEPPVRQSILIQQATMEYITELLFFNPKGLLLFRDELKGWMMTMNQYRAGDDLQKWLEMWNNKKSDKGTKTAHYFIPRSYVSILGAIQPKVIEDLATDNNVANGLFQRFLYAYPYVFKRSTWSKKHPSQKYMKIYNEMIKWIHNLDDRLEAPDDKYGEPVFTSMKIAFSKEAEKVWIDHYNWISKMYNSIEDENAAGIYSKHDTYTARFSLILRMLRYADEDSDLDSSKIEPENTEGVTVDKEDIENAIKLSKYFIHQSLRILESMESPVAKLKNEYQFWYKSLPETFTKGEARKLIEELKPKYKKEFGKDLDIADRTLGRLLNNSKTSQPIFQRNGRGYYSKLWEL